MVTWLSFCALNTSMSMASWSSSVSMLCPIIVAFTVDSTRSWVPRVGIFSHTCTTNQNQHILYAGQSESQAVSLTNRIIIFLTPIREHCSFTEKSESQEVSPTNQKAVQFCWPIRKPCSVAHQLELSFVLGRLIRKHCSFADQYNHHMFYADQSERQPPTNQKTFQLRRPIRKPCSFEDQSENNSVTPTNQKAMQFRWPISKHCSYADQSKSCAASPTN